MAGSTASSTRSRSMEHVLVRSVPHWPLVRKPDGSQRPSMRVAASAMAVLRLKVEVCNRVSNKHLQRNAPCDHFAFLCMVSLQVKQFNKRNNRAMYKILIQDHVPNAQRTSINHASKLSSTILLLLEVLKFPIQIG